MWQARYSESGPAFVASASPPIIMTVPGAYSVSTEYFSAKSAYCAAVAVPVNVVVVKLPLALSKVRLVPDLGARSPVAEVTNKTLQEVSVDSSVTGKVEILAAGNVPEEIFDASVVSVVAELDNPAIFEAAIAAELLISALTITASFIS